MDLTSAYLLVRTALLVSMLLGMAGWSGLVSPITAVAIGGLGAGGAAWRGGLSLAFAGGHATAIVLVGLLWGAGCLGFALAMDHWRAHIGVRALLTIGLPVAPLYIAVVPRLMRARAALLASSGRPSGWGRVLVTTRAVATVAAVSEARSRRPRPK